MVYNLKKITEIYVRGFFDYIKLRKLSLDNIEALYDLFSYSIKVIHELPPCERNYYTENYGDDCISYLKKLKYTPKRVSKLSMTDKINIVMMCNSYFVGVALVDVNNKDELNDGEVDVLDGFKESF